MGESWSMPGGTLVLAILCVGSLWPRAVAADEPPGRADNLPVVVLVGDSIRLGYAPFVADRLKGVARVVSDPANGETTRQVLGHLDDWAIRHRPSVVHLNAGLHDVVTDLQAGARRVTPQEYRANLRAIFGRLDRETSARLIFATSTPVIEARRPRPDFGLSEADIRAYNRVAVRALAEAEADPPVEVDDLHAFVEAHDPGKLIGPDGLHYTELGSRALADRVASSILEALAIPPTVADWPCPLVAEPPRLDGKLEDPAWAKASPVDQFPSAWARQPSDGRTSARFAWDDHALYFAAEMEDDDLQPVGRVVGDRTWLGDAFGFSIRPDPASGRFFEVMANPRGVVEPLAWPSSLADYAALAGRPVGGVEVAVGPGPAGKPGWTVEGRVPWSSRGLGLPPRPGERRGFSAFRLDRSGSSRPELSASSPLMRPDLHRIAEWGSIRFDP